MRRGPSNEAAHYVVGEELEQEKGVIGVEVVAGDLADAPAVLQLSNRRFDLSASVVFECDLVGIGEPVVGDEGARTGPS
jgi:hypothetical protein